MKAQVSAAAVVLAAVSAGCTVTVDSHSEIVREEKRFSVKGIPDVRVATFDGSIRIQSWDKPEVLVDVEKRGPSRDAVEGVEIKAEQKGNVIEVEAVRPRRESLSGIGLYRTAYASLTVWLPRNSQIRARTGDGAIDVERVDGVLELRTGDGRIRASEVGGEMTFATGDGSISVEGARGQLFADSGDGALSVSGDLAAVKLHTGDGSIVCRASPGSSMTGDWDITTGDGSISLYLPRDFNASIDAHTGDGTIADGVSVEKNDERKERRSLRGTIGSGGRLLRVRTGGGSIRLKTH